MILLSPKHNGNNLFAITGYFLFINFFFFIFAMALRITSDLWIERDRNLFTRVHARNILTALVACCFYTELLICVYYLYTMMVSFNVKSLGKNQFFYLDMVYSLNLPQYSLLVFVETIHSFPKIKWHWPLIMLL